MEMKNHTVKYALILTCLFLAACATGPKFVERAAPKNDKSLIYLYRPVGFVNAAGSPTIFINDTHKVDLLNGGFAEVEVTTKGGGARLWMKKPATIFHTNWRTEDILVQAAPGKVSFVRWETYIASSQMNLALHTYYAQKKGLFTQVSEEVGRAEIAKTKRVEVEIIKPK
jgi:hypothetical protein